MKSDFTQMPLVTLTYPYLTQGEKQSLCQARWKISLPPALEAGKSGGNCFLRDAAGSVFHGHALQELLDSDWWVFLYGLLIDLD